MPSDRPTERLPRILMVGPNPNVMGGISAVVQYYLASDFVQRVELVYITSHRDGAKPYKLGVAIVGFARYWLQMIFNRPDLIHIHLSDKASFWRKSGFFFAGKLMRIPVLFHLHGPEFHLFSTSTPRRRRWVRRALDRADRILVLSKVWKERLGELSANPNVEVLYNPASIAMFPQPPTLRDAKAPCRLLYMGRLGERKGLFVLQEALETLMEKHPNLEVCIAGDGMIDETRRWADGFRWNDRVTIPGWLRGQAKLDAYANADIFTLPSYNEGLPMAVLEAMAAGCATVTTPVGGTPEVMTDGVEGSLVPAGEAQPLAQRIGELIDDPQRALEMGLAGRETVKEKFDIQAHVQRLLELYQPFISRRAA